MNITFLSWIQQQSERQDNIGRLARDVSADPEAPHSSSKGDWLYHLSIRKAGLGATAAMHQAWAEYDSVIGGSHAQNRKVMLEIRQPQVRQPA